LLKQLFSSEEIIINARGKGADLVNPATGAHLELDIWIPKFHIGFEYQDDYHYVLTPRSKTNEVLEKIQERDKLKLELMKTRGYTLIYVPYWWDGRKVSLVGSIVQRCPSLCDYLHYSSDGEPQCIPDECPDHLVQGIHCISCLCFVNKICFENLGAHVPNVGSVVLPSFYYTGADINNWWMGEKFDGVRFVWNPIKSMLFSKTGKSKAKKAYKL
jgi:hypothetical protein